MHPSYYIEHPAECSCQKNSGSPQNVEGRESHAQKRSTTQLVPRQDTTSHYDQADRSSSGQMSTVITQSQKRFSLVLPKLSSLHVLAVFIRYVHAIPPRTDVVPHNSDVARWFPSTWTSECILPLVALLSGVLSASIFICYVLPPIAARDLRRRQNPNDARDNLDINNTRMRYLNFMLLMVFASSAALSGQISLSLRTSLLCGIPFFIIGRAHQHARPAEVSVWWISFLISGSVFTYSLAAYVMWTLVGFSWVQAQVCLPLACAGFVLIARALLAVQWAPALEVMHDARPALRGGDPEPRAGQEPRVTAGIGLNGAEVGGGAEVPEGSVGGRRNGGSRRARRLLRWLTS